MSQFPDAEATVAYLQLTQCVIDSYLDKQLHPLTRIEKAWYAIFFVRYRRWWLLNNSKYTLANNFITQNAYACIEFNGHALITFLKTIWDTGESETFLPWKLGSQFCEKIFRAARSLTSTFSTIINLSILCLLHRHIAGIFSFACKQALILQASSIPV